MQHAWKNFYSKQTIFLFHIKCKLPGLFPWINRVIGSLLTAFFTSILLSLWVSRYIAPCIVRAYLSPRSRIPSIELAIYWTDGEKTLASSFKKWVRKRKRKIMGDVKRYVLKHKRKNSQRFLRTCAFE